MKIDHTKTESLDQAVAYRIQRTARLLRYHLQEFLLRQDTDITPEQWLVLFRLYEQDGLQQYALADQSLNDRPNITRILQKLEKKGLVVRAAHPEDRRSHRVFLSKSGREFVEKLFPAIQQERQRIFAGIAEEDLGRILGVLDLIEENLG